MKKATIVTLLLTVFTYGPPVSGVNNEHRQWNDLLSRHVKWISNGTASRVDYAGFLEDRPQLKKYLSMLSAVDQNEFSSWSRDRRLAFLINAYNAFTIDLILTEYPNVKSIKDLGSVFKSPWKKEFFILLGKKRSLDAIEHEMIRKPGAYDDPRIHFAVVCAAVGCPGIRNEAFVENRLNEQLEDSLKRFLSDHSRNRLNPKTGRLEVSKIFKWYADDFKESNSGKSSISGFFAKYADLFTRDVKWQEKIKNISVKIQFINYDWRLNDIGI